MKIFCLNKNSWAIFRGDELSFEASKVLPKSGFQEMRSASWKEWFRNKNTPYQMATTDPPRECRAVGFVEETAAFLRLHKHIHHRMLH